MNDASNEMSDDVQELLGAYVLDAVDDVERRRIERAIAADPDVAAEVDRLRVAVTALDDDAEIAPPPQLWDAIRTSIDEGPPRERPVPSTPSSEHRVVRPARPNRTFLVAAAVVAVVLLGGGVALGILRSDDTRDPVAQMTAMAEKLATAPGSRTAVLSDPAQSMEVRVVVDAQGHGFVMSAPLPALPAGETYQLWSATNGEMISVGLLGADPQMSVVAIDSSVTELALTREPARGSVAPTSGPMATGALI